MSSNSIGKNFTFTTWGESHGKAIGCVIDGYRNAYRKIFIFYSGKACCKFILWRKQSINE